MVSLFLAMSAFSIVMSISPGPVNLISLTIGINSGFKSAVPFVLGATTGFTLLLFSVGVGFGEITLRFPIVTDVFSFVGAGFIVYMGILIIRSSSPLEQSDKNIPSFFDGFVLQWLNPKAWTACLAGVAAFEASADYSKLFQFTVIYFTFCFMGIGAWALSGEKLFMKLNTPSRLTIFNRIMGMSLILVAIFLSLQHFIQ
jgi:threonine/homoserine/homoserine lactone efflux protein